LRVEGLRKGTQMSSIALKPTRAYSNQGSHNSSKDDSFYTDLYIIIYHTIRYFSPLSSQFLQFNALLGLAHVILRAQIPTAALAHHVFASKLLIAIYLHRVHANIGKVLKRPRLLDPVFRRQEKVRQNIHIEVRQRVLKRVMHDMPVHEVKPRDQTD
jgi:hypothetical protein